ncbi:MAG: hypothetical protein ACR2PX_17710 [Endozoicomonas sp.]|uniref:hypothetical protein n=1 Tax=Endozoicomonas sp. TaxID=1892382 RepID=UPI003D9B8EAE
MRLVNHFFCLILFLTSSQTQAIGVPCDKDVLKLPTDHWLLKEEPELQKKMLWYVTRKNTYECEKFLYINDLLPEIERTAKTGNRTELDLMIDSIISSVPDMKEQAKLESALGEERVKKFMDIHTKPFDLVQTLEGMGLL